MRFSVRLIFSLLILLGGPVLANPNYRGNIEEYDVHFGVGYKQYWIKGRGDWDSIVQGNTPGFDINFGWRFHDYFELGVGYEWTIDKPKNYVWKSNASLLNLQNASGQDIMITSKIRFKTGYADLNVLFPMSFTEQMAPEGIVSFGVGSTLPKIKFKTSINNAVTNLFTSIGGRSKTTLRLGFGIQTRFLEDFGARLLWRFENTAVLRSRNSVLVTDSATSVMFNNGQTLALILFARF